MKKISPIHYLFACRFDCMVKLLVQNKGKIAKGKRWQVLAILLVSLLTYPFVLIEELFCKFWVNHRTMENAPLFILGFWRSGTTYLQNLICEDQQFGFLNTVTSYANNFCMTLEPIATAFMKKYAVDFRFMDNMESKLNSPCEEEFAVANRTTKSLVHMAVFPENFELYQKFTFTKNLSEKEIKKWKKDYEKVIKKVYFMNKQRRLVLKSPDHTCHAKVLCEMFPKAQFVYIYRDPYKVICSFKHTITKMIEHFSFQEMPEEEKIEDFVIDLYKQAMEQYKQDKKYFENRLIEIKYEDFVKAPMKFLREIYGKFEIQDFKEEKFEKLLNRQKDYQTNQYEISERLKEKIQRELENVFHEYGYEM